MNSGAQNTTSSLALSQVFYLQFLKNKGDTV